MNSSIFVTIKNNMDKQKVKTVDGYEVEQHAPIFYIEDKVVKMAALRIGFHDQKYRIYKSKTNALKQIR